MLLATALVGCKNPVVINEVVYEDKSPYEYKLPNSSIDLNDYRYVGDYIFSDVMDFTQWKYTNSTMYSQYGYFMVLEKISRVKYYFILSLLTTVYILFTTYIYNHSNPNVLHLNNMDK